MTITITRILETERYEKPNSVVPLLQVFYKTEKGYEGSVTVLKNGATKEIIQAAVKDAAAVADGMIGSTFK